MDTDIYEKGVFANPLHRFDEEGRQRLDVHVAAIRLWVERKLMGYQKRKVCYGELRTSFCAQASRFASSWSKSSLAWV